MAKYKPEFDTDASIWEQLNCACSVATWLLFVFAVAHLLG